MPPIKKYGDQNELIATKDFKYANWTFDEFNPVQSRAYELYEQEANCLVAANTSAGKTCVAEMFLSHEIRVRGNKGMFLSPYKALSQEKIDDWTDKECHFNDLNISICTGDYRLTAERKDEMDKSDLIIMTSEMLGVRCRNFKSEQNEFLKGVQTLVVDEAHLLTQSDRGPNLEAALMKFSQINPEARIIMLSATMPNVSEIAEWVSYTLTKRDTNLIESKYRPCPLQIHYETYWDGAGSYERNESQKVAAAFAIFEDYPDDKFLIFAHTKRTGEMMKGLLKRNGYTCEFHNADLDKSRRVKVEKDFREGELQVVVATSTLSAGLNMPARRVIVLGVHRGLSDVSNLDIIQMCGRAGRPKYDRRGDAYILLPERKYTKYVTQLQTPETIQSQMLDKIGGNHKVLAFHLVSDIHHGNIKTKDDVHEWYEKSLACFQNKDFGDDEVDSVLELLIKCGSIYEKEDIYHCSSIGVVASLFYYSPFDVADLKRGFNALFHNNNQDNDFWLSLYLGNTDTHRKGIVSKAEREAMGQYHAWVNKMVGGKIEEPIAKAGYAYFNLLNGRSSKPFIAMERNLKLDFPRVSQVLQAIDTMSAKWDKKDYFRKLSARIMYGVEDNLIDLCKVPNVGKVRAELLYKGGIKTPKDIAANPQKTIELLNMKKESAEKIVKEAKKLGDKK